MDELISIVIPIYNVENISKIVSIQFVIKRIKI